MKCSNCKKEIDDDSLFCEYCGTRVQKKSKKWLWVGIALVACILVIVGINSLIEYSEEKEMLAMQNQTFTVYGVPFMMIYVEGGSFVMGCTSEQSDCYDDERPAHRVTVDSYYIGETEVTQELWRAVMGDNPSHFRGDETKLPVEQVSWDDCQLFVTLLNRMTGRKFRLPTEAEWEYAARGGRKSEKNKYAGDPSLDYVGWYGDNSGSRTHDVKSKIPNELGIYDMSGNVYEWCQDWYGDDYYANSPQANPTGPSSGSYRVLRGGSWVNNAQECRVALRDGNNPSGYGSNFGFRLVLVQ